MIDKKGLKVKNIHKEQKKNKTKTLTNEIGVKKPNGKKR